MSKEYIRDVKHAFIEANNQKRPDPDVMMDIMGGRARKMEYLPNYDHSKPKDKAEYALAHYPIKSLGFQAALASHKKEGDTAKKHFKRLAEQIGESNANDVARRLQREKHHLSFAEEKVRSEHQRFREELVKAVRNRSLAP